MSDVLLYFLLQKKVHNIEMTIHMEKLYLIQVVFFPH